MQDKKVRGDREIPSLMPSVCLLFIYFIICKLIVLCVSSREKNGNISNFNGNPNQIYFRNEIDDTFI